MKLDLKISIFLSTLILNYFKGSHQQSVNHLTDHRHSRYEDLIWCTINTAEQRKCQDWASAVRRVENDPLLQFNLKCEQGSDREHCMNYIENGRAHMVTLDPGELFIAGRYHSLVPIVAEKYQQSGEEGFYSVAVVKKSSSAYIQNPSQLKNKKACFPGVGNMAGWVLPLSKLIVNGTIEVKDCNNIVKTAAGFFNESCAPQALNDKNNPSGDNPQSICALCRSKCSGSDEYANFDGAFKCLLERGDVAFLKHSTPKIMFMRSRHSYRRGDLELLCPQGGRQQLENYRTCNWGFSPSRAVVVLSTKRAEERERIQRFLEQSSRLFNWRWEDKAYSSPQYYSPQSTRRDKSFDLAGYFDSEKYDGYADLLFSDDLREFKLLAGPEQTFRDYLGNNHFETLAKSLKKCPVPSAKFCVISEPEYEKCRDMMRTFRSALLKPDILCVQKRTATGCMAAIRSGDADLAVFDAADVYRAGHQYGLIPIVAEKYDLNDPSYYAVAVTRKSDQTTDLNYLRGVTSCHSGVGMAAGWVVPLSFLISNNRMRSYGCDSLRAASQFFQKSCAPGSLAYDRATSDWGLSNLCDLCVGQSRHYCARDPSEPYFGHTGALQCLIERGAHVAFVKHTTVVENTAGRNQAFWSRNLIPEDFELLCRDGNRAAHNMSAKCNIGRVAGNALVTSPYKPKYHIDAYINLFLTAQQSYGSKYSQGYTFKMFVSKEGYHDLIFSDATSQLIALPPFKRSHTAYLGQEFMNSMRITDCSSHSTHLLASSLLSVFSLFVPFYMKFFTPTLGNN